MKKVIPIIKVKDCGCFSRKQIKEMSFDEKKKIGLIMSNDCKNVYRYYQFIGLGGSYKEKSMSKLEQNY